MTGADWRAKWPEEVLRAFVHEEINHYGYEVSAEDSKQETSKWKLWLWLEKHEYDFAYDSIAAQISSFRMQQVPSGVFLEEERGLLLGIRGVMREILGLKPLTEEQKALFLATVPLSNHAHWASVRRPLGPADIDPLPDHDFSHVFDFAWNFLVEDKPDYIRIIREAANYDNANPELFADGYTSNGAYSLYLGRDPTPVIAQIARYHITVTGDLFFRPGNLKLSDALWLRFVNYVRARVQGQDQ